MGWAEERMAVTDADVERVKEKYRADWKARGWHMIMPRSGPDGAYLWIGVDPAQPLPAAQTVEGVPLVFEHTPRLRPQAR